MMRTIVGTTRNAATFLILFSIILFLFLNINTNLILNSSYAQETKKTNESETAIEEETEEEIEDKTEEELDISLTAEFITYEKVDEEDLIIAKDGVELKYQDIEIKADYLKINLDTNLLFASGEVLFKQDETETNCEELTYNWKTKKIILLRLEGELAGESIKGKVYYQGEKMENFPETVEIAGGSFTTCELEEPHYHIVAKEMIIYPKDKIIARNISWYEGKIKIFTLPYFLIFLDRKTQLPILPKIGQNSDEGWYAKINFNYYVNEKSYGTLYIDWFEKRGIGTGIKHFLEIGGEGNNSGDASFYLYQIKEKDSDSSNITGKIDYQQNITDNLKTQFVLDYSGRKTPGEELLTNSIKSNLNLNYDKKGEKYDIKLIGKYTFSGTGLGKEELSINGNIKVNYNYNTQLLDYNIIGFTSTTFVQVLVIPQYTHEYWDGAAIQVKTEPQRIALLGSTALWVAYNLTDEWDLVQTRDYNLSITGSAMIGTGTNNYYGETE